MKKLFVSMFALLVVLASCSKSQVIDVTGNDQEISFNPYLGKAPVTKGSIINEEGLKAMEDGAFHVYAFMHTTALTAPTSPSTVYDFDGVINTESKYMDKDVYFDTENEGWDYEGVSYWPDPNSGRKLTFCAYALNNTFATEESEGTVEFGEDPTEFVYTVPAEVEAHEDLIVAPIVPNMTASGDASTNVNIQFKHVLSKIGFKLISNNDDKDIKIKINSLTLNGSFYGSGNVDLKSTTPSITPVVDDVVDSYTLLGEEEGYYSTSASKTATRIYANNGQDDEDAAEAAYMMIIPCASEGVTINVNYEITGADAQDAVVTLPAKFGDVTGFEAGKSYEFVLKVSTTAIGFSVEVEGWSENVVGTESFPLQSVVTGDESGDEE